MIWSWTIPKTAATTGVQIKTKRNNRSFCIIILNKKTSNNIHFPYQFYTKFIFYRVNYFLRKIKNFAAFCFSIIYQNQKTDKHEPGNSSIWNFYAKLPENNIPNNYSRQYALLIINLRELSNVCYGKMPITNSHEWDTRAGAPAECRIYSWFFRSFWSSKKNKIKNLIYTSNYNFFINARLLLFNLSFRKIK